MTIREAGSVVIVEVPPGEERPYSCASGFFRRLDGATQKMSNQELRVMFQEHDPVPFEEKIHPAVTWNDISKAKVRAFQKEAHISPDGPRPAMF